MSLIPIPTEVEEKINRFGNTFQTAIGMPRMRKSSFREGDLMPKAFNLVNWNSVR